MAGLDPVGVKRLHLEAEASRLAYDMRDTFIADPDQADVPVDRILSKELADELRAKIDLDKAMTEKSGPTGPEYRDTVYLTVVDRDRNAVSFINSLYFPFGSGLTAPKSGVILQNRGAGFRVEPGHPNCVAPGKRPLHTIIPGMVRRDGKVAMSYGVMGGGYQPVGHVHVIGNMTDYGMDPQEAIDCARAFYVSGRLELERGVPADVADGLAALGHTIGEPKMPFGGGQAIAIDWQRGTLAAGSDPRKDGCAIGY
jgi:gamma-glutamyltranspeptidase/glutathione hydrolase